MMPWKGACPDSRRLSEFLHRCGFTGPAPESLRYCPKLLHVDAVTGTRRKIPAIVAAIRSLDGAMIGCHYLGLNREGTERGEGPEVSGIVGRHKGGAVRLSKRVADSLALTVGIEAGLLVQQLSDKPTWATLTASGFESVKLPDAALTVDLWVEPAEDPHALRSAESAAKRFATEGRAVHLVLPPDEGVGWAQTLRKRDSLVADAVHDHLREPEEDSPSLLLRRPTLDEKYLHLKQSGSRAVIEAFIEQLYDYERNVQAKAKGA